MKQSPGTQKELAAALQVWRDAERNLERCVGSNTPASDVSVARAAVTAARLSYERLVAQLPDMNWDGTYLPPEVPVQDR